MAQFVYVFRGGNLEGSPEQLQEHMKRWTEWMTDITARGIKRSGIPLERRGAKVVNGAMVTDGPYAEKDIVAGVIVVEATDVDHAVRLSAGCPLFDFGGLIEIREVLVGDAVRAFGG